MSGFKIACNKNNYLWKKKKRNDNINKWIKKIHRKQNVCYIRKNGFSTDNEKYQKVTDHCHYTEKYRGDAHNVCNLRCKTPKEIPLVFHNGLKYNYHFIIKELAKEFEGQFNCLGENTKKYITFSVSIR